MSEGIIGASGLRPAGNSFLTLTCQRLTLKGSEESPSQAQRKMSRSLLSGTCIVPPQPAVPLDGGLGSGKMESASSGEKMTALILRGMPVASDRSFIFPMQIISEVDPGKLESRKALL